MKLTPEAAPLGGTVPRHFALTRTLRQPTAPPTFGLYKPGTLYPEAEAYEDVLVKVVEGADQSELTDYSGTVTRGDQ